jgi:hypothetical protein
MEHRHLDATVLLFQEAAYRDAATAQLAREFATSLGLVAAPRLSWHAKLPLRSAERRERRSAPEAPRRPLFQGTIGGQLGDSAPQLWPKKANSRG